MWKSDVYGFPFTNAVILKTYACSGQLIHVFVLPNKPKLPLQIICNYVAIDMDFKVEWEFM